MLPIETGYGILWPPQQYRCGKVQLNGEFKMARKITALATALLLLTLLPTLLLAQSELTLEDLAETVAGLTERIDEIEQKLTHGAYVDDDGNCRLAVQDRLHATSMVSYLEKYPDSGAPGNITLNDVYVVPGTGIAIKFSTRESTNTRLVTEYWSGCEFVSSSEWWAVDFMGNRIEE